MRSQAAPGRYTEGSNGTLVPDMRLLMALRTRPARLGLFAFTVGRIYLNYKIPQVLRRLHLYRDTPARISRRHRRNARLLYHLAVTLQGLMIKPCQFISSRADLTPDEYIDVLSGLQDKVPPRPYRVIAEQIQRELGAPPEKLFAWFDRRPLAAASLAQVHRARLHDGREVAVKVQYPGVDRIALADLKNMSLLTDILARIEPTWDFRVIVRELEKMLPLELDFINEGHNAERVADDLKVRPEFVVPGIIWEHTSRRVLTMDYIDGIKITDIATMRRAGIDPERVAQLVTEAYCEMLLINGFFHADPHPGNLLVLPGPKVAFVDFGLSKGFTPPFLRAFVKLTYSILNNNEQGTAEAFQELGFRTKTNDPKTFVTLGDAFLGRAVRENRTYADPEMAGEVNAMLTRVLKENPVVDVPGDIVLVGRVTGLVAGLSKTLGSKVDLLDTMMPYVAQRALTEDGRERMRAAYVE
jgi:predicted unusual protein kinase regulating ubiquinone biosynthesis (AarF/ABC1/UbiB family)